MVRIPTVTTVNQRALLITHPQTRPRNGFDRASMVHALAPGTFDDDRMLRTMPVGHANCNGYRN
jgi:hypothetical protein